MRAASLAKRKSKSRFKNKTENMTIFIQFKIYKVPRFKFMNNDHREDD